jgi:hypothetical protein
VAWIASTGGFTGTVVEGSAGCNTPWWAASSRSSFLGANGSNRTFRGWYLGTGPDAGGVGFSEGFRPTTEVVFVFTSIVEECGESFSSGGQGVFSLTSDVVVTGASFGIIPEGSVADANTSMWLLVISKST